MRNFAGSRQALGRKQHRHWLGLEGDLGLLLRSSSFVHREKWVRRPA